jgi:hypothetical protein
MFIYRYINNSCCKQTICRIFSCGSSHRQCKDWTEVYASASGSLPQKNPFSVPACPCADLRHLPVRSATGPDVCLVWGTPQGNNGATFGGTGGGSGATEDEEEGECRGLFRGLRFFLGREVPREQLLLVLRAFGAEVGWEGAASPFSEQDDSITHQVPARPLTIIVMLLLL